MDKGKAARMGKPVGREEIAPVILREMTKLEHRLEMLHRDRHGIGGIGYLRDEGTVLAERPGQTLPRSGRPIFEHPLEDGLVFDHRIRRRHRDRSVPHRPPRAALPAGIPRPPPPFPALLAPTPGGAPRADPP